MDLKTSAELIVRPYYKDELVTLYHCDFRTFDGMLPATVVITDPPYEETGLPWDRWPSMWPAWLSAHVPQATSLWCFGSMRMFVDRAAEFTQWRLAQDIVWEKSNGSSLHNDRFRKVHEHAVQFYSTRTKWRDVYKQPVIRKVEEESRRKISPAITRQGKPAHWGRIQRAGISYNYNGTRLARSVMFAPAVQTGVRHGTPKPVSILRDLVSYSCPPGGGIADIMCGSGSSLVAAKELGRRAIGFDRDIEACREAAERCTGARVISK